MYPHFRVYIGVLKLSALWYSRRFERRYSDTVGVLKIDVLSVDNLIVGLMNIDVMEERSM